MKHPIGRKALYSLKTGSSRPVVMEADNGNCYLVKMRESLSHPYASITDFIACRLGMAIGFS